MSGAVQYPQLPGPLNLERSASDSMAYDESLVLAASKQAQSPLEIKCPSKSPRGTTTQAAIGRSPKRGRKEEGFLLQ